MTLPNVQAELTEALFLKDSTTDLLHPSKHIEIYRNNIFATLVECLKSTYPMIQTLLGHDFFAMTAKEYIRYYPSRSGNLHDYGEYFGNFLAAYQPVNHLIYLAEIAEFEWACHKIYLASDTIEFNIEGLRKFTTTQYEQLRFTLNPASHLHKYHFPILQILDLCLTNPDETVNLHKEGAHLLILRNKFDLSLITLSN